MGKSVCVSLVFALVAIPAWAGARYDRKLEQAAMRIVAENIGDIRGGFSYDQKPRFVVVLDDLLPEAGRSGRNASPSVIEPPVLPAS